jgi:hypothetical protein
MGIQPRPSAEEKRGNLTLCRFSEPQQSVL